MGRKRSKFSRTWRSQTDLGRAFGMTAVALGKILKESGLKDENGPTPTAISDGWAVSTPLADGRAHHMWNKAKTSDMLRSRNIAPVSRTEDHAVRIVADVRRLERSKDEGTQMMVDKLGPDMIDGMLEDVPDDIREEVGLLVDRKLGQSSHADAGRG